MKYCTFPRCQGSAPLEGLPICGRHAQQVYLAVKDRLENASLHERIEAASKIGGSKPILNHSRRPGVVYFARFGYLIKIGFTTDLDKRMAQLKPDEVLLTIPGTMQDEKRMHERFRRLRDHHEYFLPGPELTDFISGQKVSA